MIAALAPGFLLTLAIAIIAYLTSLLSHALDPLLLALVLGALARMAFGTHERFVFVTAYAKDLRHYLIVLGIVLYAMTLDLRATAALPLVTIERTLGCAALLFVSALALGWLLKLPKKTSWLVAAGSAICGVSAIAITSSAIDADDDDVSNSMIAITLVGLVAVALFVAKLVPGLDGDALATFGGATLQQTGLVQVAFAAAGKATLQLALAVKVLRIACLPVVALGLFVAGGRVKGANAALLVVGLLVFALVAIVGLTTPWFDELHKLPATKTIATVVFAMAVANVGILVDVRATRLRPIVAALGAWLIASGALLLVTR